MYMIYNLLSGGEQGLAVLHPSQHLLHLVEIMVAVVRVSIMVEILIRVALCGHNKMMVIIIQMKKKTMIIHDTALLTLSMARCVLAILCLHNTSRLSHPCTEC